MAGFIRHRPVCMYTVYSLDGQIVSRNHLVGLVVQASASRAADPKFDTRLRHRDFSVVEFTSDFRI